MKNKLKGHLISANRNMYNMITSTIITLVAIVIVFASIFIKIQW